MFHTLIQKAEQRSLPAEAEMKINPQSHQSFKLIKLFFDTTDWDKTSEVTGVVTDVTIQKETQEQIRKSRELLNATINSSLDIIQVFEAVRNKEGEIVDFTWVLNNEASERMYGDVIGKSLLKNNPGVVEEGIFETFKKVVETGIPDQSERYYVHEQFNGWFYQSTVKLNDGVATTTRDITERKIAEQEILRLKDEIAERAEEKYRTLFDAVDEGFAIVELIYNDEGVAVDYRFLEVNRAFERRTGLANAAGKLESELAPTSESYWREVYDKVARTGEPVRFENYHQPTGHWYSAYISSMSSTQVAIFFDDVTERKNHEKRQAYLLKLNDELRSLDNPIAIEEKVTQIAMNYFSADRCYYCTIEGGRSIINRDALRGNLPSVAGVYPLNNFAIFKKVVDEGRAFVVNDAHVADILDEALKQLCIQLQVISFVDVPVVKNGNVAGVLCIVQSTPRIWTQIEIELATETAERIWAAVERAKAEEAVKVQLNNYQKVNTELREARKAALNLVEDAIQSKEALRVSEEQLKQLNASLEQQVAERTTELKASKDLLQSIFDTTLIGICLHEAVYDGNGDIVDFRIKLVNKELERLTAEKDLAGKLYTQQYPGIRKTPVFEAMIRVMQTGEPSQLEYMYEYDGFEKWFSSMFVKLGNNIIATNLDISERKKHEEDIFKNLSILQQSEEIILMGSWEYDIKNRKLSLSNGMLKLFDLDYGEETSPDLYIAKATKETRSAAQRIVKKITSEYEPFEELVQLKHDGGAKVIKVKATVIRDEEGKALKMVGVDIDITNESRSQEIMRMMTESLFEVDNNWRVIFINAAALNFFSIEREKIEGHGLWNVFPEMTGTAFHRSLLHAMQDKKSFRKEFYSNRTHRWIYASVTPSARGLIVLFTDIQAQKNAAERLKESEQRLRSVVENTPDIITRWDKDRKLIFANHAFEDKTGMPILQALGKTNEEMGQPDHIAEPYMHKLDVVLHTAMSTEHFNYFPSPVGERYYYSRMVPEFDTDGRVQSVLAIARDITDLKKVQEELLDKNKRLVESQQSLERKDNFIRIASHELKTPITSLQGYAQLLLDAYEDEEKDPFLAEGLTVINRQVSKLTKLINDLLDITRVDTGSMRLDIHSFDLCEMIQETITFMKPTTTHELNFTGLDYQQVIGDKERINQVFLNLLTNAIKYSPNADKVEIHVEADDDFVTVAVKDYGIGIANQFHDKIFDRFYRVQGSNEQTFSGFGIGLYIATEIVKRHHGKIWVDSSENEGSTFYFSLPLKKD
ncbi:MAG: PAS domain-containing protein [Ilyomonas sp.]